jgi:hypothetical protein
MAETHKCPHSFAINVEGEMLLKLELGRPEHTRNPAPQRDGTQPRLTRTQQKGVLHMAHCM